MILVCRDRYTDTGLTEDFYSSDWNHLDVTRKAHGNSLERLNKPINLKEMIVLSEKLSNPYPFMRVDFYIIDGKTYFGELTFFPASGFETFIPDSFDSTLGSWLLLPSIDKKQ